MRSIQDQDGWIAAIYVKLPKVPISVRNIQRYERRAVIASIYYSSAVIYVCRDTYIIKAKGSFN